jgi:hypothetical protein
MVEIQDLHLSLRISQYYQELLRLAAPYQQIKKAHTGEEKEHRLLNLALAWLDWWVISIGTQSQNNPDPYYPYFWSGPGTMMGSSRFRRIM